MTGPAPTPVVLNWVQASELRQLLEAVLGWLADGDPGAHADLACHLVTVAACGGPLAGAGADIVGLFESFLGVYASILDPEP